MRWPCDLAFDLCASRDYTIRYLRSRASIVWWEGILRIAAFFLLAGYGLFGGLGISVAFVGTIDLVFGLVYVFGLPRSLDVKASQLFLDSA
jgi:hypothetical protein